MGRANAQAPSDTPDFGTVPTLGERPSLRCSKCGKCQTWQEKGVWEPGARCPNLSVTDADTTAATQAERLAGPVDGSEMRQR